MNLTQLGHAGFYLVFKNPILIFLDLKHSFKLIKKVFFGTLLRIFHHNILSKEKNKAIFISTLYIEVSELYFFA